METIVWVFGVAALINHELTKETHGADYCVDSVKPTREVAMTIKETTCAFLAYDTHKLHTRHTITQTER